MTFFIARTYIIDLWFCIFFNNNLPWGVNIGCVLADDIFKCLFLNEWQLLHFDWNFMEVFFLQVQLVISLDWFRLWHCAKQATSHYLKQYWPISIIPYDIISSQWVNCPTFCPKWPLNVYTWICFYHILWCVAFELMSLTLQWNHVNFNSLAPGRFQFNCR